ncbi:MAG: hypothetical protein V9G29_06855 [Burkholderiaceae bacterium]
MELTEGATGAEIRISRSDIRAGHNRLVKRTSAAFLDRAAPSLRPSERCPESSASAGDCPAEDYTSLFRATRDDPILNFSMADIGEISGKDKSTVSRQLGKQAAALSEGEVPNG